jgi:hypothetical protein
MNKKSMETRTKRIEFKRETLRNLQEAELKQAAGGSDTITTAWPPCPLCN